MVGCSLVWSPYQFSTIPGMKPQYKLPWKNHTHSKLYVFHWHKYILSMVWGYYGWELDNMQKTKIEDQRLEEDLFSSALMACSTHWSILLSWCVRVISASMITSGDIKRECCTHRMKFLAVMEAVYRVYKRYDQSLPDCFKFQK